MGSLIWGVAGVAVAGEPRWQDQTHALPEPSVEVVACGVGAFGDRQVWLGGAGNVWRLTMRAAGMRWESLLNIRGSDATVHDLLMAGEGGRGYAATSEGLYVTSDGGRRWRRTFTGAGRGERAAYQVAVDPRDAEVVWLAAAAGLFVSRDSGASWQLASADLPEGAARWITVAPQHPQRLYLITDRGFFTSDDGAEHWRQALQVSAEESEEANENGQTSQESGEARLRHPRALTSVVVAEVGEEAGGAERVYVTSLDGVLTSRDGGATWTWLPSVGLGAAEVRHSLWWHDALYAATAQGVFRYDEVAQRWLSVGSGLADVSVRRLSGDQASDALWAATEEGVFQLEVAVSGQRSAFSDASAASSEPSILEVQEAAIRYADVHPAKIQSWRQAAAAKAALPTVTVSYDQNRSITDRTDEGSFPAYQVTDEKDRDDNWTFSVSWDLGELIWNDDQTSIDVRSRLMVQLRDDVLDEVNRLYFERQRLLAASAIGAAVGASSGADIERQIRLEELTAGLDALTGGWFSQAAGAATGEVRR